MYHRLIMLLHQHCSNTKHRRDHGAWAAAVPHSLQYSIHPLESASAEALLLLRFGAAAASAALKSMSPRLEGVFHKDTWQSSPAASSLCSDTNLPCAQNTRGIHQASALTIIETPRVPHPVVTPRAAVEVHAVCSVKHVDPIVGVLAGVAVHDVHQHDHAQPVGLVDHRLELVRGSKSAAGLQAVGTGLAVVGLELLGRCVLANPAAALQADVSTGLPLGPSSEPRHSALTDLH